MKMKTIALTLIAFLMIAAPVMGQTVAGRTGDTYVAAEAIGVNRLVVMDSTAVEVSGDSIRGIVVPILNSLDTLNGLWTLKIMVIDTAVADTIYVSGTRNGQSVNIEVAIAQTGADTVITLAGEWSLVDSLNGLKADSLATWGMWAHPVDRIKLAVAATPAPDVLGSTARAAANKGVVTVYTGGRIPVIANADTTDILPGSLLQTYDDGRVTFLSPASADSASVLYSQVGISNSWANSDSAAIKMLLK